MTTVLLTAIWVWMALGLLFWAGFVLLRLRFECATVRETAETAESRQGVTSSSGIAVGAGS